MNPLLEYTISALIWSTAGFVVGWLAGVTTRNVERIADAVDPEEDTVGMKLRWKRPSGQLLLGLLVVLLGIATAVQGLVQSAAVQRVSDCQQAYSTGFADALDARSQASAAAQDSLDTLMSKVGTAMTHVDANSRGVVQKAVDDYLAARAKSKATAAANPYPPAPRDLCK